MTSTALEQAQVEKTKAETAAINWELERKQAVAVIMDRRSALAIGKARYELAIQKTLAREAELELTKQERDEKLVLTQGLHTHVHNFVGGVDRGTVGACIERLSQWDCIDPTCDMTIIFNSPGGSVIDGMSLFDYIRFMRSKGHNVTIIALGMAASMAGILLQAGTTRVMAKGSWLLIHEVAFSVSGKVGEVEDEYKFGLRLKEQAASIFVERSGGKLTRAALEKGWKRTDWWISPDEALKLGLIDEVR
jgi:ATP-dependent Clp endopeptidase proteolytic subunit ClpP